MKLCLTKTMISAALSLGVYSSTATANPIDLQFVYHLDAGMAEQDVFVESAENQIFRVTTENTDMAAALYATTIPVHHNPFDPVTNGPYEKGAELGVTLGEWLGATGDGTFECFGETGTITVEFDNLIPNGVYTMWHFFMPMPASQPFTGTIDLPYGPRDGSQATFVANANGSGRFEEDTESCLQLSGEQLMAGLAIAYHSDGQTHAGHPGDFAMNSHIQLFAMLPSNASD